MIPPAEIVFTFASTHDAIRGERALMDGEIAVKVMALPSSLGAGCGLCLRVPPEAMAASRSVLETALVTPQGVYGKYQENGRGVYTPVPCQTKE